MYVRMLMALASVGVSWCSFLIDAQDEPGDRLREALASHMRSFNLSEDRVEGEGAEFLIEQGAAAEFFLIGESHGTRETPQFTAAVLNALKPRGYSVYAIETGPEVTDDLTHRIHAGDDAAVREVLAKYPLTAAFLFFDADREVFINAVKDGWDVWGLDQEFIASGRYLLSRLIELAPNDDARALAEEWFERAVAGFDHFMKTGDQSKGFLIAVTPADFDRLDHAFAEADEKAKRILRELRDTAIIYGHYGAGRYFHNNLDRIRLMKRHVAERLEASAEAGRPYPKIIYRFGSVHTGRGYTPLDQLDLGNQAAEVAALRGGDSFHVLIAARTMVGPDGAVQDLTGVPGLEPLLDVAPKGESVVFDLRAMRPLMSSRTMSAAFPETHDLGLRFDAVVILPEFHAAESMNELPGGN